MLDKPAVALRLPGAAPSLAPGEVRLSYASANGGRSIQWRAANGASTLDLHVSHGLEVNVEADLDPAVDHMNTEGPIAVDCTLPGSALIAGRDYRRGRRGVERQTVRVGGQPPLRGADRVVGPRADARPRPGHSSRPFRMGGRAHADLRADRSSRRLRFRRRPGRVLAVELRAAPAVVGVLGELSMGGLWATDAIPENTSRANFTAHWGGGLRLFGSAGRSLMLGYRFQHISNGNNLGLNPGVNSHVVLAGWSRRSARGIRQ